MIEKDFIIKIFQSLSVLLISIFKAITDVAWGIASIFLMLIALNYYDEKYGIDAIKESINPMFIELTNIIINYIWWFVIAFFIFYITRYVKEAKKK